MSSSFLKKVPLFAGLAEADLEKLCQGVEEVRLSAGKQLFAEGDPGDKAYVIEEGQVEVLKNSGGRELLLAVREPGEVIGEMALLEQTPRMATVRARRDSLFLAISKEQLDQLLSTSHSATRSLFYTVLERWRSTEGMLLQNEKMAQLGTLTAGVAHELNNPAAAIKRGADQLGAALRQLESAHLRMGRLTLTEHQREKLQILIDQVQWQGSGRVGLGALERSDREQVLQGWLEERGVEYAWETSSALVDMGHDAKSLEALLSEFPPEQLPSVISWLGALRSLYSLSHEVGLAAGRISDIVKALKSYSYLDQAPTQSVDVHEGLDNTLILLRSKLRPSINVRLEYSPDLPRIEAYGSELNQVWTNIIDNAADALEGRQGEITIRTRKEDDGVVVEVEDDGPGIPPHIQPRVFDSFFTTKPPGKGTGLGLSITYNIVVHKHRGNIKLFSQPGRTCFQVWLPTNFGKR